MRIYHAMQPRLVRVLDLRGLISGVNIRLCEIARGGWAGRRWWARRCIGVPVVGHRLCTRCFVISSRWDSVARRASSASTSSDARS
jgi:hypothetical protein